MFNDHKVINLNNLNNIFIDKCKEIDHINKLEFFSKDHNTLCCTSCIAKIKDEGYGQHSGSDICHIKYIKDEKKIN